MLLQDTVGVKLTTYTCWCGLPFALPESLFREYERANDAKPSSMSLYCPLGHAMTRGASNRVKELQEQVARERAEKDQLKETVRHYRGRVEEEVQERKRQERRVNGYKGALGRVKRRVAKGTCPCCSRKFKDLEAHMKTEHPSWDPDKHAAAEAAKADA